MFTPGDIPIQRVIRWRIDYYKSLDQMTMTTLLKVRRYLGIPGLRQYFKQFIV